MARWQPIQLVGGAYADDALPWSAQDCVNYIPVPAEKEGTRSREMLRCLPGLVPICDLGTNAPIRGMRNVEGRLFVISGTRLFMVNLDGSATDLGEVPGVKRCSLSHNQIAGGNEVVISNGQSGYVYNTAANTLEQITDDGFPGAISFDYVDGYILGIEPARRFAFTSDLADAGAYSTLDRYEAEGSPDLLVGQAVTHREWWLMGERTIEPLVNTGAATGTFQRSQGTVIEVGLAATHAVAIMDNSVFWLGSDGIVYRANGYTPQRISTHAIEQAIARCNMAQAFAFTFEDRGHKVFYLTFHDGQTWGYDAATGEWHRRRSHNLDRWRINCLVKWRGAWVAGDYANGRIYQLDWNTQGENGEVLERRRITGVTHDNQNALIINGIELVVDTGHGTQEITKPLIRPLSITGDMPDAYVGQPADFQYTVLGGSRPVTVTLLSGALPDGWSLGADGTITGSSVQAGSYSWVVQAEDSVGNKAAVSDSSTLTGAIEVLIHFDGTDGSKAYTDESGHTWLNDSNNTLSISTARSMFGGASLLCPTGQQIQYIYSPDYQFVPGSQDFTIECWGYLTLAGSFHVHQCLLSNYATQFVFEVNESNKLNVIAATAAGTVTVTDPASFPLNQWVSMAVCRKGGTLYLFRNGAMVASAAITGAITTTNNATRIGDWFGGGQKACWTGNIDELRIITRAGLYTSSYTPQTQAFPNP